MMTTMDGSGRGPVEVLLIAGRSGVGKTSIALMVSARLQASGVAHCHVEGDNLDAAYPKPPDDPRGTKLTEANLRALWSNYARIGHRRLIFANTVSVLERDLIVRAVGGNARTVGVLLSATDDTVARRLAGRESGDELRRHLIRSRQMATVLLDRAPPDTHRVTTDDRSVEAVAVDVLRLTGWG
jgi:gluconate kinase